MAAPRPREGAAVLSACGAFAAVSAGTLRLLMDFNLF
jgi:hypothetical protein